MYSKEHTYKGYDIRVSQDVDAPNPRQWGLGTILSIDGANEADYDAVSGVRKEINRGMGEEQALRQYFPDMVWFHKLYRYSHSGDVWALHDNFPYRRWDVSHAGYVIVTREDIREWYNRQRMSEKLADTIYGDIARSLDELTNWANGFVFGFMIKDIKDPDLDSVWYGGYNDPNEALDEAKARIDHYEKERAYA